MVVQFREHRGDFVESMATTQQFTNISDMMQTIFLDKGIVIVIQYYAYDTRLPADTFIIKNLETNGVLGFMWFEETS